MAELRVIRSGSSGNAYIIECQNETLLVELGLPFHEIICNLFFRLKKVCGAIVTHKHSDHLNRDTSKRFFKYGIPVYSCEEAREIDKHIVTIKKGAKTRIGGFKIQPIPLQHSCECYGYIIEHEEIGKMVFATDCSEFLYRIKDVNHLLIEANYSDDCLIDNMCNNEEMRSRHEYHLELNDAINAIKANYNTSLMNVILLHLSNGNSNKEQFVKKVKNELGFDNVFVAKENLVLSLQKEEF